MPAEIACASAPAGTQPEDPRVAAFCSPQCPDLFQAVVFSQEICRPDPYDVETIHAEGRSTFERLVSRATTPPGLPSGRVFLLRGEAGSGKTHLMRAFRNYVHGRGLGYCGYMSMTSSVGNYARYVLGKLMESLDQPYYMPNGDRTGLMRLADAVAETPHAITREDLAQLREAEWDPDRLADFIRELADYVREEDIYRTLDLDLVRSLLYLQRAEPRMHSCVLKYLRCEDLEDRDKRVLGGLVPRKE
jgi:hypothetical protein